MGRNGQKPAIFPRFKQFINENVGKIVTKKEILLGEEDYNRGATTSYIYKFAKLGYIKPLQNKHHLADNTEFLIVKGLSEHYSSISLGIELRAHNGFISDPYLTPSREAYRREK